MSTDLQAGELFLEDDQQQSYRLSWTKNESGDARLRSLPAGNYRLRTYRMEREQDGQFWHASASGQNIQRVTLRAGQNTHLELDQSITIHSKINKGQAQMGISGQKGAGLSIYRDSVRIPMGYRLLSSEGEQLASGSMNYG